MLSKSQWQNLGVRIVSALGAVAILLVSYLWLEWAGIIALSMVIEILVIREGVRLVDLHPLKPNWNNILGFFIYSLFLMTLFFEPYRFVILVSYMAIVLSASLWLPVKENLKALQSIQNRFLMLSIYLGVFPALLVELLFRYHGALWFLSVLGMVFAGDIGAYAFGITLGRRHVLPSVSPKKTWAGALGGLLSTIAVGLVIYYYADLKMPVLGWAGLSALISIVAQAGDFFESLLKRLNNVKDSGSLMPGHGGILDRIDGLIFAAPIMSLGLVLFDKWL